MENWEGGGEGLFQFAKGPSLQTWTTSTLDRLVLRTLVPTIYHQITNSRLVRSDSVTKNETSTFSVLKEFLYLPLFLSSFSVCCILNLSFINAINLLKLSEHIIMSTHTCNFCTLIINEAHNPQKS